MKAGFAEVDITPPLGISKIGWLKDIKVSSILDPIFAKIAIFENESEKIAFIQLDTLSIRWTLADQLRTLIEEKYGFPGKNIMVSATHNHAGPAVANCGLAKRDEAYVESMLKKCLSTFSQALSDMCDVTIGFQHMNCFNVGYNRRTIMRNGITKTHGCLSDPDALCSEGPVDPELAVLVVKNKDENIIGSIVNFTCHPTHHGGSEEISAGYPGALAYLLKTNDCPVTLFLNGAYGNITTSCSETGYNPAKEQVAEKLFMAVKSMLNEIKIIDNDQLGAFSETISLPYRTITENEINGTVKGAQRFIDSAIYDKLNPEEARTIEKRKKQPAEVQVLQIGDIRFVGIPAEYFVELGLKIKENTYPAHTLIVGGANGMVGYVPTKDAFKRGGYETTFGVNSKMGHDAGDILADTAIKLINDNK